LLFTAVAALPAFAQGVQTGTLRGTVVDAQDAAIPGATVTVESPSLLQVRSEVTDAAGLYVFRALPPGEYTVTVTMPSFKDVTRTVTVPLGGTVEQNAHLVLASLTEEVHVVGTVPPPMASPTVGINVKHAEVEALATSRTLQGIATLSPAVNTNTPNAGQLAINGGFSFDNIFMVNGVDVNDNLFGSPQNLFIEDAIDETQVLTSGISAEYGRFSGGVVNAITKSGGNTFSGSYRLNLTNPAWVKETPFEVANGVTHANLISPTHEATFGGPIVKNRLWFFSAGRLADTSTTTALNETGIGVTSDTNNKRGEIKLTGALNANHQIQGGYVNNSTTATNTSGIVSLVIDPNSLITRTLPNSYYFTNYRGILGRNVLVEAQYSQRKYQFQGDGGTSTNIVDSPFSALSLPAIYNAPYFDATDPESRNNKQLTGSLTYYFEKAGRHEVKTGYEFFQSQRIGGNSQSSTNYVFDADYEQNPDGSPVLDSTNRPVPVFDPGNTQLEHWLPVRGATLNVNNNSFYAQDHWTVNRHLSADYGFRFERVRSEATGGIIGVNANTLVPRVALGYDVAGDGHQIIHVTYGHYSGRYDEAQIGANNNVGNPDVTIGIYNGPAGSGRDFAPGFDPSNYEIVFGQFPTQNVSIAPGLSSPVTKEFTTSYGADFAGGRGYAQGTYVWRHTSNFIADYIDLSNGTTDVVSNGVDAGEFTNVVYRNTGSDVVRRFQSLVFQGRYKATHALTFNGNWTVELQNDGNYEGEAANQPGLSASMYEYPEAFNTARTYPYGTLKSFQRNRGRLWAIYTADMGRAGTASISGIVRIESGLTYSLVSTTRPLSAVQNALLADYPDAPASQDIYFAPRGSESFKGYGALDISVNYELPVFRTARPFVKFDLFNALNNDKLISWNTVITPDAKSPLDSLGLPTGYIQGARFGTGTSNNNYPSSSVGNPGLRGFRVSFGMRF
jgi:hypothetical protein